MGLTSNSLKELEKVLNINRLEDIQSGGQSINIKSFLFRKQLEFKKRYY